jgi:hypothetical protein
MKSNYCELKKNKIYEEMYDELLDEELNMNDSNHNNKIKNYLEKKINSSIFVKISENFTNSQDLIEDLILKIESDANNNQIQGNTLMMYADDNSMYELFYMEDLTKSIEQSELNEFASLTNIFLQPICWTCGIFKSTYQNGGKIFSDTITKYDVSKLFIQNYYHIGVMVNLDKSMIEIEFTGENPFKIIGNNYTQSNTLDLFGFNIVPWIEKINNQDKTQLNEIASKIMGTEIFGKVFFAIVCPNTNKKFWDITKITINNILSIIDDNEIKDLIQKEIEQAEININPFYFIKKYLK